MKTFYVALLCLLLAGCDSGDNSTSLDDTSGGSDNTSKNTAEENLLAADLYDRCAACHGVSAEKSALNHSDIISNYTSSAIKEALVGYKNETRNRHGFGPLMLGQVSILSTYDMQILSNYISAFNNPSTSPGLTQEELGERLYSLYIRPSCDLKIDEFTRIHTQSEWAELMNEDRFKQEIETLCPDFSSSVFSEEDILDLYTYIFESTVL